MLVDVKVIPKSSRNLIKQEAARLKAYLTVAPEKGKANQALIELIAEHYNVKKSQVRIVKGARSALKVVSIGK
ncbi:MAG TPA: hypothetical protein DCL35_08315 [Candidatus Omnitrophica bacterium]|nr:hypothetical protein [Candidatus Omnitrophota bacterium]